MGLVLSAPENSSGQDFSFVRASVAEIIHDIEQQTPYRFLYRDALVSGVRLSFTATSANVLSRLRLALEDRHLRLQVDPDRGMVFVLPLEALPSDGAPIIRGTVSDARSLERLPHATLSWTGPRGLRGVVSDESGRFVIEIEPSLDYLVLAVSFLGYATDSLRLDCRSLPGDLAIKLRPRTMLGSEILVASPLLSSNLDSTWHRLLHASLAAPSGEQSVTRSLQMLPAVGLTTAVSSGLNVRGSRADGFEILLDGVPIYNQTHLFGIIDAFSPDALQAVDFYYGIAPARFQAPPGGTLSFLTKAGSKKELQSRIRMTTASVSGTAEGPMNAGGGSWLVSARRSYLDSVDWFNNDGLIAIGLGLNRETSGTRRIPLDERTLVAEPPSAMFYDVHGKIERETAAGSTFQLSAYVGGDRTSQDGERVVALSPQRRPPQVAAAVTTSNDWGNAAFSAHYRSTVKARGYSHSYVGLTHYYSSFRKDDFFYRVPQDDGTGQALLFAPFLNENRLTAALLVNESLLRLSPTLGASFGFSTQRRVSEYSELSALRQEFENDGRSWQVDLFTELEYRGRRVSTTLGLRPHYFSSGDYLRLSPRFSIAAFTGRPVSVSLGYTRNYQFVHRLYVENAAGTDVWVLANENQPPGAVDHLTASILYKGPAVTAQIEGYYKHHKNLRRHETLLRPTRVPNGAVLLSPWTHDNTSRAEGVETLLSTRVGAANLTATYTLSRVEIQHPDINSGAFFFADWDRPHQFTAHAALNLSRHLSASLAWSLASGQPNAFSYITSAESPRLSVYRRADCSLEYIRASPSYTLSTFIRIYNLFDTQNVWYRTAESVLLGGSQNLRLAFEPVDVYDLGLQPSIGLSLAI